MKRITTPVLCLLLGLIMTFVVLVDVSGATADSWDDDDDRASYRHSTWHHHNGHREKRRAHHRKHQADHADHDYEECRDDAHASYHPVPGDWEGRGTRSGEHHIEENRPIDIRPETAAVWRNPPAPVREPQRTSAPPAATGAGPCREYHTTARIGGREQQIYGQACRQPDGAWKFEPDQN